MSTSGLKAIAPVIHKNFKISRIRNFYMRKVKFTQDTFDEKLGCHPERLSHARRHSPVLVVPYERSKGLCPPAKFGDSLYRCKQLKKAALGRMATIMRRQKRPACILRASPSTHLPSPRNRSQHPHSPNLGYPNVGKSSFINKVTRADVDVQPYAFTTKSLFVGHLDYKYLRWQVIDPGHPRPPAEEMNTIEMQSITALAHLKSCCGYTVAAQCALFHSIKPLFAGKPTVLVLNKTDVMRLADLRRHPCARAGDHRHRGRQVRLGLVLFGRGRHGPEDAACDALLAHRVDNKVKGSKISSVINRIHVAHRSRATTWCARHNYLLANPEWKMDVMPEIMDGKNIADFIDPDIAEKLEALEREEERLEAEGFYASDEDLEVSEDERERVEARIALSHKIRSQSLKKSKKNQSRLPRSAGLATLSQMTAQLTRGARPQPHRRARGGARWEAQARRHGRWMDVDGEEGDGTPAKRLKTNLGAVTKREPRGNRALAGMRDQGTGPFKRNLGQRPRNMLARAGEGDRTIKTKW
ncbi:hypothetical protein B0H14DRAFT_3780578 [Mycena olivaceomarginata]|nr:hypothetical protein B0H14DRAFT_3780578 [Mycena olivaceomarginata]